MLTEAQRRVWKMRSDLDKVAVPVDRSMVPPDLLRGLKELVAAGFIEGIDRNRVLPHVTLLFAVDVYQFTPAGVAALEKDDG